MMCIGPGSNQRAGRLSSEGCWERSNAAVGSCISIFARKAEETEVHACVKAVYVMKCVWPNRHLLCLQHAATLNYLLEYGWLYNGNDLATVAGVIDAAACAAQVNFSGLHVWTFSAYHRALHTCKGSALLAL